jgi:hypothetical protein
VTPDDSDENPQMNAASPSDGGGGRRGRVVVTNPDPTLAVIERLELLERTINEKFKIRDEATSLARGEMKETLVALSNSVNEKFNANDKLVSQLAAATKALVDKLAEANNVALNAALATQEKLAAKFEVNVGDLLKGVNEKIDVLRAMVTALTSRIDLGQGGFTLSGDTRREDREVHRDAGIAATNIWGIVISIIGVIIAASAVISAVILSGHK